jgi:hypothetical protein
MTSSHRTLTDDVALSLRGESERERVCVYLCITELAPVDLDDGNHSADISDEDLVGVVQVLQVFERDRFLALSGPAGVQRGAKSKCELDSWTEKSVLVFGVKARTVA